MCTCHNCLNYGKVWTTPPPLKNPVEPPYDGSISFLFLKYKTIATRGIEVSRHRDSYCKLSSNSIIGRPQVAFLFGMLLLVVYILSNNKTCIPLLHVYMQIKQFCLTNCGKRALFCEWELLKLSLIRNFSSVQYYYFRETVVKYVTAIRQYLTRTRSIYMLLSGLNIAFKNRNHLTINFNVT